MKKKNTLFTQFVRLLLNVSYKEVGSFTSFIHSFMFLTLGAPANVPGPKIRKRNKTHNSF